MKISFNSFPKWRFHLTPSPNEDFGDKIELCATPKVKFIYYTDVCLRIILSNAWLRTCLFVSIYHLFCAFDNIPFSVVLEKISFLKVCTGTQWGNPWTSCMGGRPGILCWCPKEWNKLHYNVRSSDNLDPFKTNLYSSNFLRLRIWCAYFISIFYWHQIQSFDTEIHLLSVQLTIKWIRFN